MQPPPAGGGAAGGGDGRAAAAAAHKAGEGWAALAGERAEAVLVACMHAPGSRMDKQAATDAEALLRASAGSLPFSRPARARRGPGRLLGNFKVDMFITM
jgi:hypothetical protein